jgi:hypothetical protein
MSSYLKPRLIMRKIRWGLKLYDFVGKIPFGTTHTYSPAEDRAAWQWYVDRINETPQVLEKIRHEVWESEDWGGRADGANFGECPIESEEEDTYEA